MSDIVRDNTVYAHDNSVWEDDRAVPQLPMNDLRYRQMWLSDLRLIERHVLMQMNRHLFE